MLENKGSLEETKNLKPALFRFGDNTYKMHLVETDGGKLTLVHDTELPDYPRDGGPAGVEDGK